jgi:hypothetical protein
MQSPQTSQVQINHAQTLINQHCNSLLDVAIEVPDPTRVGSLLRLLAVACFGATGIFGKLANEAGTPRSRLREPAKPSDA